MFRISMAMISAVLLTVTLTAQSEKTVPEQTVFFEGDKCFEHSSPLPAGVLKALLDTEESKSVVENSSDLGTAAGMFHAVEVHLAGQGQVDLVVEGTSPLTGADTGWFWVVRSARDNPEVILFAKGNSLELLNSRSNGYRDIRSRWSSPSETRTRVYRFKNRKYELKNEKWTED